jgi:hypothetical protein
MAIDTAARRLSVIHYTLSQPPRPDVNIAAEDRAALVGDYAGLYSDGSGGFSSGTAVAQRSRVLLLSSHLIAYSRRRR